jgi:hypothetical protein
MGRHLLLRNRWCLNRRPSDLVASSILRDDRRVAIVGIRCSWPVPLRVRISLWPRPMVGLSGPTTSLDVSSHLVWCHVRDRGRRTDVARYIRPGLEGRLPV